MRSQMCRDESGKARPESRLSRENADQITNAEANPRFCVAFSLLEVACSARDPEVRKLLNLVPAADVRDHMVDVPSAPTALVDPPMFRANVAATIGRLPYTLNVRHREPLLTRIDYDWSRKYLVARCVGCVSSGVDADVRRHFAIVVVIQGISKRVALIADCVDITFPGDGQEVLSPAGLRGKTWTPVYRESGTEVR